MTGRGAAVVTGGARGIGRSIVERLAADGWSVAFTWVGSEDAAKELESSSAEGRIAGHRIDVRDRDAMKAMIDAVSETGPLQLVVNNAGVRRDALAYNMSDSEWSDVIETNLSAAFTTTQLALPHMMRARGGSIVNIASLTALHGVAGQANYAAAKGGMVAMTRVLAREVARSGIRVNCVAPGLVATDMIADLPKEARQELLRGIPMRRVLDAREVASVVAFLASAEASGITGQTIAVDGGASA